jgi:hypothetical protein
MDSNFNTFLVFISQCEIQTYWIKNFSHDGGMRDWCKYIHIHYYEITLLLMFCITNGLICTNCGYCFYINYASTSLSAPDSSFPWYCIIRDYHKHVKQQEGRFRHLEEELKLAGGGICNLGTCYIAFINFEFLEDRS